MYLACYRQEELFINYMKKAQNRFVYYFNSMLKFQKVCSLICKSFLNITISELSTAMSVPLPIANPTSVQDSAGGSLIPVSNHWYLIV